MATEATSPPSATRGSLLIVFLIVFIDLLGFAMVLPLLPLYAVKFQADNSGLLVGVLMASFSAMQFIFSPLWGQLSDRVGRRPILLAGLFGAAVFYTWFGIATMTESIVGLFISRIGAGIACGTIPVAQAYIADCTTLENRAKGMALIGAAFGLGFCLGPLLGAAALVATHAADTSPWPGFAAGALSLAAFLLGLALLPESRHAGSETTTKKLFDRSAWLDAWQTPSVGAILIASFTSILSFGGFETTLSLLLKDKERGFSLDLRYILFYYSYIGIVLTIVQGGLVRRLSGKVSEGRLAAAGALVSVLGFALLTVAAHWRHLGMLMFATAVEVCGFAFITPSVQALLSRRSDPKKQGSIAGVSQSVSALARIGGPVFANFLFKQNTLSPYIAGLVLMLVGLVLLQRAVRQGADYVAPVAD